MLFFGHGYDIIATMKFIDMEGIVCLLKKNTKTG